MIAKTDTDFYRFMMIKQGWAIHKHEFLWQEEGIFQAIE